MISWFLKIYFFTFNVLCRYSTGETNTVRHFTGEAFKVGGMELRFEGEGVNEVGGCTSTTASERSCAIA